MHSYSTHSVGIFDTSSFRFLYTFICDLLNDDNEIGE